MRFRRPMAIAASIAVLALAVPITVHLMRTAPPQQEQPRDKLALEKSAEAQPNGDQAAAPPPRLKSPPVNEKDGRKVAEAPPVTSVPDATSKTAPPPLYMQADNLIYDKNRVIAQGNVEIYYNNFILTADKVIYDQSLNKLTAEGNAQLKDPNGQITRADVLEATDDFRDAFIRKLSVIAADNIAANKAIRKEGNATSTVTQDDGARKVAELPKPKAEAPPPVAPPPKEAAGEPKRKVAAATPPPSVAQTPPPPSSAKRADAEPRRHAEVRKESPARERSRKEAALEPELQKHLQFSKRQGPDTGAYAQALRDENRSRLSGGLPGAADDGRDRFAAADANRVKSVTAEPLSTFSIDVDTASYAFVRRSLNSGRLPPKEAVRIEEMINYFPYQYPLPEDRGAPFQPTVTVLPSPWNPGNKLVHIAIKGYDVPKAERPRVNLVLLIDTSGSMAPEDRLPLLRNAFRMLVDTLRPEDTVGIVTYAGTTRTALEPTRVAEKRKILEAIEGLNAGGGTAGGQGIQEAYRMAEGAFDKAAVNRVILATDGDFNIGITDVGQLKSFIERKRETGIYLSVLGVGRGNYNDALMQALAQNGNGTAAYIDTLNEARKVLVDEVSSTLFPIAKDVRIQIEFNPAAVSEYRLIGYETRLMKNEDFNNDKVDSGDIGSGHTVTAIYEITPVGSPRFVEDLRYKQPPATAPAATDGKGEYGFLKINYKLPSEAVSRRIELPITQALEKTSLDQVPAEVRFSAAVAAFGQLLKGDPYLKGFGYDEVIALAAGARGEDPFGYRAELLNLVRLAKTARP
jgi:Ca-activated chloride channel homolog